MVARGVQSFCILEGAADSLPTFIRIGLFHRRAIARKFQLNGNNSETTQDIDLKLSAFVYHMSGLN